MVQHNGINKYILHDLLEIVFGDYPNIYVYLILCNSYTTTRDILSPFLNYLSASF